MAVYVSAHCACCNAFFTEDAYERECVCPACGSRVSLRSDVYPLTTEAGRIMYSADSAFYARKFDEAARLYAQAAKTEKKNPAPHYGLALCKHEVVFGRKNKTGKSGLNKNGEFKKAVKLAEEDRRRVYAAVARDVESCVFDSALTATATEKAVNEPLIGSEEFVTDGRALVEYKGIEENIVIPDGITDINAHVFMSTNTVKSVHIPASVRFIDERAFSPIAPERITVDEKNRNYISIDGCLIDINARTIVRGTLGARISVEYADTLGRYAFESANITDIAIPEGIEKIDCYAFADCGKLNSISIPSTVKRICSGAFSYCTALENIAVAEDNYCFYVEDGCLINTAFNSIIRGAADGRIARSAEEIGPGAYDGCGMKRIVIPASLKCVVAQAFTGCNRLETIDVENGNTVYESVSNCLIERGTGILVLGSTSIPSGGCITIIDDYAFSGSGITSVTAPSGVEEIGDNAFSNCKSLISVDLSEVETIGNEAFCGCSELVEVTLSNTLETIGNGAFRHCKKLERIKIPESVEEIGDAFGNMIGQTFSQCVALESVVFEAADGWYFADTDEQVPFEILSDESRAAELLRGGACLYKK